MSIPRELRLDAPPLERGAVCLYPWDATLARLFTVAGNFDDQEPMKLWTRVEREGHSFIGLPWNCCPEGGEDVRVDGTPVHLSSHVKPRSDEQARVMTLLKQKLCGGQSFILQAPTGEGKTIMGLDAIAARGVTTVVVVPKDDLIDGWIEACDLVFGLKPSQVGRIQGDVVDVLGKDIVIASLKSVSKPNRYPPWVYRHFGLLVIDEVHRAGADQMGEVLRLFAAGQRLGLSATPRRKDGKDLLLYAHIGPIAIVMKQTTLSPKVLRFESMWRCPKNNNGDQIPHKPGRVAHILKFIFNNTRRNRMICHFVREARAKGRTIIIFSDHTDHLEILQSMLQKPYAHGGAGIAAQDIGKYWGDGRGEALKAQGRKPVVLATVLKAGEGTNFPEWDTAILATPRSDVEQIVGRIVRWLPNKKQPIVFDILDSDSWVFAKYARTRLDFYHSKGAEVIDAHLSDADLQQQSAA